MVVAEIRHGPVGWAADQFRRQTEALRGWVAIPRAARANKEASLLHDSTEIGLQKDVWVADAVSEVPSVPLHPGHIIQESTCSTT